MQQETVIQKYREMVARGICAHAAAVHVINYTYMLCKEDGLSFEASHYAASKVLSAIKRIWEDDE